MFKIVSIDSEDHPEGVYTTENEAWQVFCEEGYSKHTHTIEEQ
ncbi:unnamed protein product [marine sediment metagenome]|uniref:Uncharacterized protein n=1 Tax=marine sediment metagenome TaxID=412755 RepID=X1CNT8_9ZZZZ